MKGITYLLFGLFVLFPPLLKAHSDCCAPKSDTIPFHITAHNNIVIEALLNEQDTVRLMFHTAASGITLIQEATARLTSIKWNHTDTVNSWGGQSEARYSASNSLKMGNQAWRNLEIWENRNSGPGTDGKFGPELFENKAIEVDFDRKQLVIHSKLPNKASKFKKLKLAFEDGFMFVSGTSYVNKKAYENRFLIHSGYGGTILYDDEFVAKTEIGQAIEIIDVQELKDSYGNVLLTKKGYLPKFKLGGCRFKNVPVGFFEGAIARQKMSVIGGDLIKRFNLIIDAERGFIYVQRNRLAKLGFG